MEEKDYICYTDKGHWHFWALNDTDAIRKALAFCWRDDEKFIKVESDHGKHRILTLMRAYDDGLLSQI